MGKITKPLREGMSVIVQCLGDEYHGQVGVIGGTESRDAGTWITVDFPNGDVVVFLEHEVREHEPEQGRTQYDQRR